MGELQEQFGAIDIYLFDQLLRGRIAPEMRVVDAGCGFGRNLIYLLREGYEVFGADVDERAVEETRRLAARLAPHLPTGNFRIEAVEAMSFPDACAEVAISSAVLHFARDHGHFQAMLRGTWRVLRPGGLFFARLASSIGIEDGVAPLGGGRFRLPDGSDRYLVDEARLMKLTEELGAEMLDPLKTTVVQNQRSMTTWVLRKNSTGGKTTTAGGPTSHYAAAAEAGSRYSLKNTRRSCPLSQSTVRRSCSSTWPVAMRLESGCTRRRSMARFRWRAP